MTLSILLSLATATCTVVDGDTLRCDQIGRVRLLGIDAPELPGHCRKGRVCAPGDGENSKRSLGRMARGSVTIQPVTRDRYGRTVAQVYASGQNLACEQIKAGQAVYVAKWDNGRRLAKECGAAR